MSTSSNGYAHTELHLRKEARITCQEEDNVRLEYVVYSFWMAEQWVMAVHVFGGQEFKSYMYLSPETEIGEELRIEESGLVMKLTGKYCVDLGYPVNAVCTLHDIHIN